MASLENFFALRCLYQPGFVYHSHITQGVERSQRKLHSVRYTLLIVYTVSHADLTRPADTLHASAR